jgi:uncharacterized membrane protein YbaN (DUF454 family)
LFKTKKLVKGLLIGAGSLSAIMGLAGIFFPVLPTTPFLLLAAICYMRSSQYLYKALLTNRFLGNYIRNYLEGRGMTIKAKILTLVLLWMTIVATSILATSSWTIRIVLAVVVVGVTVHILLMRTTVNNRGIKTGLEQQSLVDS